MNVFEKLTDQTALGDIVDDMALRYTDSVLSLKCGKDSPKLVVYNGFYGDYFIFKHFTGEIYVGLDDSVEITVPRVKRGFYSDSCGRVFYFFRNPKRQWKRGLTMSNSYLATLESYVKHKFPLNCFNSNYLILEDDKELDIYSALKSSDIIGEGKINLDFAVTKHRSKSEGHLLWYHTYIVGEIDKDKKIINVQNQIFKQEVLDNKRLFNNYLIRVSENG